MKRLFAITASLIVLFGAISGAVLQSTAISMIAYAVTENAPFAVSALALSLTYCFFAPSSKNGYAHVVFLEGICEKIQDSMTNTFGSNAPSLKRTALGALEAVTSAQNTAGMKKIPIDPGDGKDRQVRLKYIQRGTADDIGTTRPSGCATEKEPAPKEQIVTITNELYTKGMKFTQAQMRKLCEGDQEYIAGIINSRLDPFMVQLNKLILQDMSGNFGNYFGGSSAVKSYNLLKSTGGVDFDGEADLLEDLQNLDAMGRPIVIGAEYLSKYVRNIGIGCCNQEGQNLANAGNMDFFHDKYVAGILGSNHFLTMVPGNIQLMTFNENVGEYAETNQSWSHGTFIDPRTNLKLDIDMDYNNCDRYYSMHFGFKWEMYYLPGNAFTYGDDLYGFNGLLHGLVTKT